MNFNGWVAVRRGILAHTMNGRLSNNETLVLLCLVLLADKGTGSGEINAPVLRNYLPGLSSDGAKRALSSLENKRYIYRQITPRSPIIYPYWVNKYEISAGPYKAKQLNLNQVFKTKDLKDIQYVKPAPEGAPRGALEGAPESALESAHYNNKDQNIDKEQKQYPVPDSSGCASMSTSLDNSLNTGVRIAERTLGQGCAAHDAHNEAILDAPVEASQGVGLRWSGAEGGYLDKVTGQVVPLEQALRRITRIGLEMREGKFFDLVSGEQIPWKVAQSRISGVASKRSTA